MGDNEPIKSNNSLLSSIDQNKCNYEESQALLNGISQVVICGICNEEFAKTNKEYNAQKDDWILKNACYADGSTSKDGGNKDNVRNLKIVHRKCYQLKKQQQQNDLDDDDRLKPKLYDKNQTISKIEEHFNENGASLASSQIEKKQKSQKAKKRKIDHLFDALDDEHCDVEEEEQGMNGKNEKSMMKKKKIHQSDKEEMDADHDDVVVDDDDLQGIGIDDIDQPQMSENPITFSVNNENKEHLQKKEKK